jgi:TonB family protein
MGKKRSQDRQSYYPGLMRNRIIMTALLASALIHTGILLGSPDIFRIGDFGAKIRVFKVDLIRPPMEEIRKQSEENQTRITQEAPAGSAQEKKEANISLDTTDAQYYPYAKMIKERIQLHWTYPMAARERHLQGNLLVIIRLERNGRLVNAYIARSSGYQILDSRSIQAIELASPFPPFPETIPVQFLNINASFTYKLKIEE